VESTEMMHVIKYTIFLRTAFVQCKMERDSFTEFLFS